MPVAGTGGRQDRLLIPWCTGSPMSTCDWRDQSKIRTPPSDGQTDSAATPRQSHDTADGALQTGLQTQPGPLSCGQSWGPVSDQVPAKPLRAKEEKSAQ